jgi:hypothetical protein
MRGENRNAARVSLQPLAGREVAALVDLAEIDQVALALLASSWGTLDLAREDRDGNSNRDLDGGIAANSSAPVGSARASVRLPGTKSMAACWSATRR